MQTKDATRSQQIEEAMLPLKSIAKPHAAVEASQLYTRAELLLIRDTGLRRELCIELCAYFKDTPVPNGARAVWESFC